MHSSRRRRPYRAMDLRWIYRAMVPPYRLADWLPMPMATVCPAKDRLAAGLPLVDVDSGVHFVTKTVVYNSSPRNWLFEVPFRHQDLVPFCTLAFCFAGRLVGIG